MEAADEESIESSPEPSRPKPTRRLPEGAVYGDYELLEEVAHGGMGVVYRARQRSLNRIVALKLLLYGRFASEEFARRFQTEAAAAASLHHPNIVAIHESGEQDGQLYFSMEFVEGRSLAELVRERPLPDASAARYLKIIAEAIHYAHQHGIVHRDLKPSNVLIDTLDQPRITDFGLAKHLATDSDLTTTGQVLGSPNFMPPEQAAGHADQLGPHTDVYALGAMLYHLLTGRPPFQGATPQDVLLQAKLAEPLPPRRLQSTIPVDLETICLKCLEKEPSRRYASAGELADELERFLRDEPIRARPTGPLHKLWRWTRRQPLLAALAGTVIVLLVAAAIGSTLAALRLAQADLQSRQKLWESYLAQARAERLQPKAGRRERSLSTVAKAAAIQHSLELRNEAVAALAVTDLRTAKLWQLPAPYRSDLHRFDHTLQRYAMATPEGSIVVSATADDREFVRLDTGPLGLNWIYDFSPDGRYLAAQTRRSGNCVWNLETGALVLSNLPPTPMLVFAAHTALAAQAQPDGPIALYDLETGLALPSLPGGTGRRTHLAFQPAGRWLACYNASRRTVELLELPHGRARVSWPMRDECNILEWNSRGTWLAAATEVGPTHIWDAISARPVATLEGHEGRVVSVAFAPQGDRIATSSWDDTTRLWSATRGELILKHEGTGYYQHFDPSGTRLGSVSAYHGVRLLEIAEGPVYRRFTPPTWNRKARALALSHDAPWLITLLRDGIEFLDSRSGEPLGWVPFRDARNAVATPDSRSIIVTGSDGARLWPLETVDAPFGTELRLGAPQDLVTRGKLTFGASVTPDGQRLALADASIPGARLLDLQTRTTVQKFGRHPGAESVAISPDGRYVATGTWNVRNLLVWDTSTAKVVHRLDCDGAMASFSPDGRWLCVGTRDYQLLRTGDWQSGPHLPTAVPNFGNGRIAFRKDGRQLAVTEGSSRVRVFAFPSLQTLASFEPPDTATLTALAFRGDGQELFALDAKDTVHIWHLPSVEVELAKLNLAWEGSASASNLLASPASTRHDESVADARPLKLVFNFTAGRGPRRTIQTRDGRCSDAQVDLSAHYTSSLDEDWFLYFQNDNLSSLPHGLQRLEGTEFDLRGLIQLQGIPEQDGHFPERADNLRVDRKCSRLHFLHATHRHPTPGPEIGHYLVHYANGSETRLPLVYGQNILDWWHQADEPPTRRPLERIWTGHNAAAAASKTTLQLFRWTWENPLPDLEITHIDFVSALNGCAPFLVALTAE